MGFFIQIPAEFKRKVVEICLSTIPTFSRDHLPGYW